MSSSNQSEERAMQSENWAFRLCGTCTFKSIDVKRLAPEDVQAEIMDLFEAESDVQVQYHHEDEDCEDSRPLRDLFEPSAHQNAPVHLHFLREPMSSDEIGTWFTARLSFHLADDSPVGEISRTLWRSRLMMVHKGSTITDMAADIRRLVTSKIKRDAMLNDLRIPTDEVLEEGIQVRPCLETRFKTAIHSPTDQLASLDLDCEDPYITRVNIVQDLFQDLGSVQHMEIPITVTLWINNQKIQDGHDVVKRHQRKIAMPLYVRVGSYNWNEVGDKTGVTIERALLARIHPVSLGYDDLFEIEAWNFDKLAINDVRLATKAPKFRWYHLEGQYEGIQTENYMAVQALQAHARGDYGRVPIFPRMALRPVHPASEVKATPSAEVTVAVSLINHLEDDAVRNLNMTVNCQIAVRDNDTPATTRQAIFKAMKDGKNNARKLLSAQFRDTWKCELWVMNQDYVNPTMSRFVDGHFAQFMSKERMAEKGRKMYMECHVWPKDYATARALPC